MTDGNDTQTRKHVAVEFLQFVIAGNIDEAYARHVDMHGKHHNAFFPAGFWALRNAMNENHAHFPSKQLIVKNVLGDGDLVAVHSHIIPSPGEPGVAAVHLLRFQGGKIVELWDLGQPVPVDPPNKDGMF